MSSDKPIDLQNFRDIKGPYSLLMKLTLGSFTCCCVLYIVGSNKVSDVEKRLILHSSNCSPLKASHGSFKCSDAHLKVGSTCKLTCAKGFYPDNQNTTIKCLSSATWGPRAHCYLPCSPLPATHGSFNCSDPTLKVGSTCKLTCDQGYYPDNQHTTIKCLSPDNWGPRAHCYRVKCPALPTVSNGAYNCAGKDLKFGVQCHLDCHHGFTPSSKNSNITCLPSGQWSTPSSCVLSPRDCEVCSGSLCGVSGNGHIQHCPSSKPYCMNALHNHINGTLSVTKSCGSETDCNSKWWQGTSDRTECTDFDPARLQKRDFSCFYCCTVSGCNKGIVPHSQTMYIGHS